MRKLLPKTINNPKGFTLIELLVVIVILAILGVIGVTIFTSTQNKARDARRKEDITAMSRALEVNYKAGTGYSTAINSTWFADGSTPTNPDPGGAGYNSSFNTSVSWVVCASLENSSGNATTNVGAGMPTTSGSFFCKKNAQ